MNNLRYFMYRVLAQTSSPGKLPKLQRLADLADHGDAGALRTLRLLLASALGASTEIAWASDADRQPVFIDPMWIDYTGQNPELGRRFSWAGYVHREDLSHVAQTYIEAFDARRMYQVEYRLRRHDGVYNWILGSGEPRYSSGAFAGFIGYAELKRAA
jgi:PAS domain-containing protein